MPRSLATTTVLARLCRSTYGRVFAACMLTLVAMVSYDSLPQKVMPLEPLVNADPYIYADDRNEVDWLDYDALQWECLVQEQHSTAFCGFHFELRNHGQIGMDLSRYTHLHVDLDYQGPAHRLRFYFRNHEPGFSTPGNIETAKFLQANIPVSFMEEKLILAVEEFHVAEWWIDEYDVPRALSGVDLRNVVAVGIDLSYPGGEGRHELQLNNIELVGPWIRRDRWYAGLMLFWMLGLAVLGSVKFWQLRRSVATERQRLDHLKREAEQLQSEKAKFRELSQHDELTGLLNRQGLGEAVQEAFDQESGRPLSLLIADIDHFKPVNDTLGHDVGDQVLKQLASLLARHVRQADCVARWGGEEFVILLPGTQMMDAYTLAEKLRTLVSEQSFDAMPGQRVTLSMGVGEREQGESYIELFRRVDKALYRAKDQGRNCTVLADTPESR
ncbi:GGDEF domain-containing protein [Marinimicrobium sp. ABcell2]|uniref:GGDEF domain-containing protein n=1 Tax=Marinimicrobium sp. ABcell2 TaxID=3069751 RepID=UPI0027B6F167|nr:GGDEF domain-containing protein [Marinimicrobium sp. ABcell2]MDQ2075273.1 GGDEF domain-containing protein [Marinimicrobium sp. ABcell2]